LVDRQGNKFIGSAQLKKGKFILQHGSMLLKPNLELFQQVFKTTPPSPILPSISLSSIVSTLTEAAAECFNCHFETQPLSPEELKNIEIFSD
jgi:lipoate-protein ligase A